MAKGCVDMDADYCLFTVGLGTRDRMNLVIDDADLVITLGLDMVEYHPRLWNPAGDKLIIHADFLPAEIDDCYMPSRRTRRRPGPLAVDAQSNVSTRTRALSSTWGNSAKHGAKMWDDITEYADDETDGSIRPQKALWDARQVMGPSDVLLSDVGAHKMWIARLYPATSPTRV